MMQWSEMSRNSQKMALSYQTKDLQEDEVIEEEDPGGEERPPHVTQRLGLVHTWENKTHGESF